MMQQIGRLCLLFYQRPPGFVNYFRNLGITACKVQKNVYYCGRNYDMEKQVLLTGATGMVGSYLLCNLIKRGYKIKALVRPISQKRWMYFIALRQGLSKEDVDAQVTWVKGDLDRFDRLEEMAQDVHHVYHCAAMVSFRASDRERLYRVNVEGTRNLVNACLGSPTVKKFFYMSSIAALSRGADPETIIDERSEWEDGKENSDYAKSKFLGELEVWRASEEGLPVVILNPGFVLGYGNPKRSSASLLQKISKGTRFYTRGVNGFIDVLDVAEVSRLLMESPITNERFVAVAHNLSYRDLFIALADGLSAPRPRIEITRAMASVLIAVLRFLEWIGINPQLITSRSLRTSVGNYRYSSAKLSEYIGYQFTPFGKTIERISSDYKEFGGKTSKY